MPTVPANNYGPPSAIPSTSYGVPELPSSKYGPTRTSYGPPTQATANETPAPIIHKHVYVHIPPVEPDYPAAPRPVAVSPVQKHYRIIFIKAPTQSVPTPPPPAQAPENEEKTIVYVLVKRPDDVQMVEVPTPAPTVPSKPEVYFIRYKTQEPTTVEPEIVSDSVYYRK